MKVEKIEEGPGRYGVHVPAVVLGLCHVFNYTLIKNRIRVYSTSSPSLGLFHFQMCLLSCFPGFDPCLIIYDY